MAKKHYKRTKLVVYPSIQYPILGWALACGLICAVFTGLFVSAWVGTDSSPKHARLFMVMGLLALFIFSYLLAFFTNRLFGPLYRLHVTMREIAASGEVKHVKLRPGDNFTEIADDFNRMVDRLSKR